MFAMETDSSITCTKLVFQQSGALGTGKHCFIDSIPMATGNVTSHCYLLSIVLQFVTQSQSRPGFKATRNPHHGICSSLQRQRTERFGTQLHLVLFKYTVFFFFFIQCLSLHPVPASSQVSSRTSFILSPIIYYFFNSLMVIHLFNIPFVFCCFNYVVPCLMFSSALLSSFSIHPLVSLRRVILANGFLFIRWF